jgi:DNA-binding MarR family transcriptional regulator
MCYSLIMSSQDHLNLEEQICFALYSASRALTARYRELLEPLGITYPQYLTLLVLWETGSVSVNSLGERLHLDSGTLSPLLRRMEQAGLISRTRSTDDERVVEITLTERGSGLRTAASGIPEQICAATGLPIDDLVALRDQVFGVAEAARA